MPLVVLDFDQTLVDVDSSEWVAEQLGVLPLFDVLREEGTPWHQAFNTVLGSLHAEGTDIAQIQQALCRLPVDADTIAAIKASHAQGCELWILSDANTFFIETFLHHHGIAALFSHIHSNPAWIDGDGRLRYGSFHSVASTAYDAADMMSPPGHRPLPPHDCPLCPPNMCKGSVVSAIRAADSLNEDAIWKDGAMDTIQAANNDVNGNLAIHDTSVQQRIIYAGDGVGDFCPSLLLLAEDFILPRQGYRLSEMLFQNAAKVKARVHPWNSLGAALKKAVEDASLPRKEEEPCKDALSYSACFMRSFPSSKRVCLSMQGAQAKLARFRGYGDQLKVLSCKGYFSNFNSPGDAKEQRTRWSRGNLAHLHHHTCPKHFCNQVVVTFG